MRTTATCALYLSAILVPACGASSDPAPDPTTTEQAGGATDGGDGAAGRAMGAAGAGGAKPVGAGGGAASGAGGGAVGGGGSGPLDAGSDRDAAPPHTVGNCSDLGSPGVWQNITPPALQMDKWCGHSPQCSVSPSSYCCKPNQTITTYGAHDVVADPSVSGALYLGTDALGIWKTTDCGASWIEATTGAGAGAFDGGGRAWSMAVDPLHPNTIWAASGYGANGVWKSTNGGVDFQNMLNNDIKAAIDPRPQYTSNAGFVEKITLDPTNPDHVFVTFHDGGSCVHADGTEWACGIVSSDGGATWSVFPMPVFGSEGSGQTMLDANTWYYGGNGFWRTTDAGAHWDPVTVQGADAGGDVYTASDGSYYVPLANHLERSTDGVKWTLVPNTLGSGTVNGARRIVDDGKRVITSTCQYGAGSVPGGGCYYSFPLADPGNVTPIFPVDSKMGGGVAMVYDPDHQVLYSANFDSGLWRIVVPQD